ncbi:DUF6059 family protein [Kitasatospora sp. A2-31]|uniref:DUF6059 family protein n=1 Tax=Kitasatospora sp. A2-31 TaxID=2916414 RepID=UPI001EEC3FD0|nr:DUF6059 family protein [Kitasatospora sp. A2-31]MCG6495482.1 hypothetical protein [Kitasatospora sp. A2-31]
MRWYWTGWFEQLIPGLSALAYGWGYGICPPADADPASAAHSPARPRALPRAHPERPAGHIPLTPAERELWSQLADVGR